MQKYSLFYTLILYTYTILSVFIGIFIVYNMLITMIIDPTIGLYSLIYGSLFVVICTILLILILMLFKKLVFPDVTFLYKDDSNSY